MKIKKFKKISAAFLAVVMVVSIFAAMPFTSFASAYTENQLKELLSEYELKINDGKVYTNLSNSYDAYYDAYVSYIGVKSGILSESEIDSAYNSLQSAMSNMFEFTPYAASNPKPSFNADSDSAADVSSTYANLLYTGLNGSKSAGNTVSRWQFEVGYNNTVMLYDGIIQPKTQVMYAGRVTAQFLSSKTRAPYSAYPTKGSDNYEDNGDLYLPSVWFGGESTNYDYTWSYSHSSYSFGNNASTSSAGKSLSGGTSASAFASYVNSIAFNENTVWSDDEYSKAYEGLNWASISGDTSAADKATAPADKSIYVINYKKLIDALNLSGLDVLNNSYSSVKTLFGALEAAQKVDPNSYFSSSSDETISSNVADCAAAIKNAVDNINSAKNSLVAVSNKSYVALAEHYKTYSSAAQGNNSNGYYTDESYADFISAFDSANPVLTDIIYKNIRMSDASQTDTNLVNGYNGLKAAEKYVDDSELQGCFEKYYFLTQSYYTEETYNALTQQISAALNLYNGNNYTLGIALEDTAENEEIYNSVLNAVKTAYSALRISKDAKFIVGASVESYNSLMDKVSAVDGSKYSNYESVLKSINDQSEIILSFDNKEFAGESQAAGEYLSVLNEIRNLIDSFQLAFTSIENGSAVSVTYGSTNGYSADDITTSLKNQILQITYFKTVSGDSSFTTEYDITADNTYYNWAAYRGAQLHGLGFGAYGQDSTGNQSVLWKEGGAAKSDSFNDSLYNYHTALMKTPQNYTVGSDYINIIANTNGQKILGEHTVTAKASSTVASTQFTTPDIYELINVYNNEKQRINTDVKQTVTVIDIYPLIEEVNAATEIVDNSYSNLYGCYTETTWNNFITALTNAKADLAYTEMSDTEIVNECKTRLSNLTNAISKLTVNNSGTHKYTEQADSIQPTCTSSGALILKCDICGNTVRTRPAALGHDKIYTSNGDSKTHTVSCSRGDLDETENCTGTDYCEFCGQQLYVTAEWDEFNTAKALMEQALAESESGTVKYTADALKTANENISEITYYNYTAQQQTAVRDTEQNEINTQTVLINNAVSALENGKADSSVYEANLSKIKTLNADAYDIAEIENAVKDVEITKTVAVNGKNYIGWIYDNYNVAFGTALTENQYEYTVSVTDADEKIWCLDTAQRLIEVAAGVNEKGEITFTPVNSGDTVGTFHYGDYISVPNPANASEVCNWSESIIAHSTNTNSSKKYIASSAKYQFNLRGNTSLYIDSASDSSLSKVITFVDSSSGKVIGTEYTASSEYVINTENLPTVPFYKIEGYKRSDTGETFISAQIGNIESDITIYVTYAPAASVPLYTITLVNENNEIIDVQIKEFNKLVTLSAPGAAAYVYSANNSDKVLWYGNEYSFYACRDIIVKAVSNAPDSAEADVISAPLVTKGGSVTEFSFIGSFAVPDDCTVQSYGIVLDLNGNIGDLTLYDVDSAKGVYNLSASKHTVGNQFTVNVTLAMDYNPSVNYVSYVVYTDKDGNTQYAYSNVITGAELPVA